MKKNFITIISAGFGVCALLAGCGEEHQAPPSERNQLVNRFFRSMENGDSVSATSQGQKLLAMDPGNDYIAKLVNIQQSNSYVERAQKLVNAGDVSGALAVVEEGLKVYPLNRTLSQLRGQLRQLPALPQQGRQVRDPPVQDLPLPPGAAAAPGRPQLPQPQAQRLGAVLIVPGHLRQGHSVPSFRPGRRRQLRYSARAKSGRQSGQRRQPPMSQ